MKIYITSSEYVVASTKASTVLITCLKQYFSELVNNRTILCAIKDAFLRWKHTANDEYGFWFHHGNGNALDHRPENIVIINPDAHRKLHNKGNIKQEIAKSSGDLVGRYDANEAFDFDNIILESMLSKDFVQRKTLAYIFEHVISPLVADFLSNHYSKQEMTAITYDALCNSGISELTLSDIDEFINNGLNVNAKMSTSRIDNETASEVLDYLNSLKIKYANDPTKQKMHNYSIQYLIDFLEDEKNIVTRAELYDEYIKNMWRHSSAV